MKVIEIKCDHDPFIDISKGIKKAEFRKNDRDYQTGDILFLKQTRINDRDHYTGYWILADVVHVMDLFEYMKQCIPCECSMIIKQGDLDFVMLSIKPFRQYLGNFSGVENLC